MRINRSFLARTACTFAALLSAVGLAGTAWGQNGSSGPSPMGSADLKPSPEHPVGWRGDGTGRFPGATPPTTWKLHYKTILDGMRHSAKKPKDEKAGSPIILGKLSSWLVCGPFVAEDAAKVEESSPADEATIQPDDGAPLGNLTWHAAERFTNNVPNFDLWRHDNTFPNGPAVQAGSNRSVYLHTYLYAAEAGTVRMSFWNIQGVNGKTAAWFNGAKLAVADGKDSYGPWNAVRVDLKLAKGWNRLLVKVMSFDKPNELCCSALWVDLTKPEVKVEKENILWEQEVVGNTCSGMVQAGNRVLTQSDPYSITCLDRNTGKTLWMRHLTLYDTLTEEEKKANAAITAKVEPLIQKLNELAADYVNKEKDRANLGNQARELVKQISAAARGADVYKGTGEGRIDGGPSCTSPCSDGKNLYGTFYTGISGHQGLAYAVDVADGSVKWLRRIDENGGNEHGPCSSPVLSDGKLFQEINRVWAMDAATGKVLWKAEKTGDGIGNVTAHKVGKETIILTTQGTAMTLDGKTIFTRILPGPWYCNNTPVTDENLNCYCTYQYGLHTFNFPDCLKDPAKPVVSDVKIHPDNNQTVASPLYYQGLLYYVLRTGLMHVFDTVKGVEIYSQMLPLNLRGMGHAGGNNSGVTSSPTLAGKRIYVMDEAGDTVVFQPGREYKEIAKNTIEYQNMNPNDPSVLDLTASCPVFDGSRIYIRGAYKVFCVGAPPLSR